jgi:RNA polymerase sigma-70 factor (ECF subfamily)
MEPNGFPDERLELLFTCCHPALALEAQVALTLRTLGGLTTGEVARAFLVSESTMGQRLSRARRKIKTAGIPFRVPPDHLLPERVAAVLAVVYLIFNRGYGGREDLSAEALRLGHALVELMPDEPEAHGLLALMLLHDARRAARFQDDEIVLLADQDPNLWDVDQIVAGRKALDRALALRSASGPYVLQAAIASLHAEPDRDWREIVALYGELARVANSPVVELNRAIALAEADGPEAGLASVERLELDDYLYLHSTRAELLRRLGRREEAAVAYRRALGLAEDDRERRLLERGLTELGLTDEIAIREAERRDLPAIEAIVEGAYEKYVERIGARPGPMDVDYAEAMKRADLFVAEVEGAAVGVSVLASQGDDLVIENVAVSPSHQGRGFGGALLAHAEEWAQRRGRRKLRLYTHESMAKNIALYERLGYQEERRGAKNGFTLVFMAKQI